MVAGLATRVSNPDPAGNGAAQRACFAAPVRDQSPDWESDNRHALDTDDASDLTGPYTVLIGYRVRPEAQTPVGLARLAVPAARYAVIAAAGEQPAATLTAWQTVWAGTCRGPPPSTAIAMTRRLVDNALRSTAR